MLFIVLLACLASTSFSLESNFYREEACAAEKGYCVLEKECPHSVEGTFRNLCAGQKNQGAVCCKNFPQDQLNCFQTHNTCRKIEECTPSLNIGQKGCEKGTTCCVLV